MKTIKKLTTFVDDVQYDCEIYHSWDDNDYFFVHGQPVDAKVLFQSETINGYLVVTEDDNGERIAWTCEEA